MSLEEMLLAVIEQPTTIQQCVQRVYAVLWCSKEDKSRRRSDLRVGVKRADEIVARKLSPMYSARAATSVFLKQSAGSQVTSRRAL